jgi:transcriptional regulator with XRE-family HTH domain
MANDGINADYFAGRLKDLRTAAGLTQEQLAGKAGMTKDGVAQLEQGRREPAWATVLALAGALGVTCEAFTKEPAKRDPAKRGRPAARDRGKVKRPQG